MRTQGATVVAAVLFLIAASPASAVTGGFGVAKALQSGGLPVLVLTKASKGKHGICEADGSRTAGKSKKAAGAYGKLGRQIAPVACEQPPRSEFIPANAVKQATAAALAALG